MLPRDWERVYDHTIYYLETFTDRHAGARTCYRAANWMALGLTTGRGKPPTVTAAEPIAQRGVGISAVEGFSAAIDRAGMRRKPVSDWTMDELKQILQRVRMALGEEDYKVMKRRGRDVVVLDAPGQGQSRRPRSIGFWVHRKARRRAKILRILEIESATDSDAADPVGAKPQPTPEPPVLRQNLVRA